MNYVAISEAEFTSQDDIVGLYTKAEDIPQTLRDLMLVECAKDDYYTPLKQGKEGLFAGMRQYQPRTAELLMEGGPLIFRAHLQVGDLPENTADWIINFGLEVHGQMVMIERGFYGTHPADSTFHQEQSGADLLRALPAPICEAYYSTFCGMKIPEGVVGNIYPRFLPHYIGNWCLWNRYLGRFRGYKKKYIPWLMKKLPETMPEEPPKGPSKDAFFGFRCILESVPDEKGVVDFLWVKAFCEDGTIYHIHGKDIENMRILANPLEAIDLYCEHVLTRKEGTFDFMPFTEPML